MRFWGLFLLALPLVAQTPSFEVASIRPSTAPPTSAALCRFIKPETESSQVVSAGLNFLLIEAYQDDVEKFDLPDWVAGSRFDISVKMPRNTSVHACMLMLRALLAERFHMVTEVETRQLPTYYLKVAKSGLKMKEVSAPADGRGTVTSKSADGLTHYSFSGAPMSRVFIPVQSGVLIGSRNGTLESDAVVNETGLTGFYDGDLEYQLTPDNSATKFSLGSSLKDALADQLGLVLEVRKAPRKYLVIRSSERIPTEN